LPDASKINFIDSPGVPLSTLLPHQHGDGDPDAPLPSAKQVHFPPAEQGPTAVDLLQRLLVYPPYSHFRAAAAVAHPWLLRDGPLVLPRVALASDGMPAHAAETRDGKTAGEWLKLFLAPGL